MYEASAGRVLIQSSPALARFWSQPSVPNQERCNLSEGRAVSEKASQIDLRNQVIELRDGPSCWKDHFLAVEAVDPGLYGY